MPPRPNVRYAPPPTVSPIEAQELSSGRSRLLMEYAQQQVANRLGITAAKTKYKREEENIRQQRLAGLQESMAGSVERGMFGSSLDITQRLGIHGAAEAAKAAAMNEQELARTGIRLNQQFGKQQLEFGLHEIDARRAALQRMAAIREFEQNTIPGSPGVGSAGGGQAQILVPGQGGVPGNPYDRGVAGRGAGTAAIPGMSPMPQRRPRPAAPTQVPAWQQLIMGFRAPPKPKPSRTMNWNPFLQQIFGGNR